MKQISAMYEWSGGTDYRHTCYECSRLKRLNIGKKKVCRCLNYDPEKNWNDAHIACKFFNTVKMPPLVGVVKEKKKESAEKVMPGQMNLFEYLEP